MNKIDEIIDNCKRLNRNIFERPGYDGEKLRHIYDEAVLVNASSHFDLPLQDNNSLKDGFKCIEEDIIGNLNVERRFLHFGTKDECGGIGQGIAMELNLLLHQKFMDILCNSFTVEEQTIPYNDLQRTINGMPADNVLFDLTNGIQYETSLETYHIGMIYVNNAMFVCAKNDMPTCDIIDGKYDNSELLDKYNFFYGCVEEQSSDYIVSVRQRIAVQVPNDKPAAAMIFIR